MNGSGSAQDAAALLHTLDEQAALFQEWLSIDEAKRQALIARNSEQLEASVTRQTQLLVALDRLESKRRVLAARLVPDASSKEPTLSQVAERLSGITRQRFLEMEQRLQQLLAQVETSNQRSHELLRQAYAHNQVLLDALLGKETEAGVYTRTGPSQAAAQSALPDSAHKIDWQA